MYTILNSYDLIKYHQIVQEEIEGKIKEAVREKLGDYKDRVRQILQIGRGKPTDDEETEEQDKIFEELADYLGLKKTELLRRLKQKCSPSAYETIESIVNQIFS